MPEEGERTVSPRSASLGILAVVGAASALAFAGWLLALAMSLLVA